MSDKATLPNPSKSPRGKKSTTRASGRLLAGATLLLAMLAAGGSAWLWWQLDARPGQLRAVLASQQDLQQQIESLGDLRESLDAQLQQSAQRGDALRAEVTHAEQQSSAMLTDKLAQLNRGQANLQDRIAEISAELGQIQRPGRRDHDWRALADAGRLLKIANERLRFWLDDNGAIRARQRAADLLATVSRPEAAALLRVLRGEDHDLAKQFPVSVAEALQDLDRIEGWVDSTALAESPAHVNEQSPKGWWQRIRGSLARLVRVEQAGPVPAGQWPLEAQRLLRLQTRLTISAARLELLTGRGAQFADDLARTASTLHRHFEPLTPEIAAAVQRLHRAARAWRAPLTEHNDALHGIDELMRGMEPAS